MNNFKADDASAARTFYASVEEPTARAVLDFLIDHPEERFNAAAIQQQLALDAHREVALAMYYMGQRCAAIGKTRPWNEAQVGYLLSGEMASLLRDARQANHE